MATHNKTGKVGEEIACRFLVKHGYSIVERNYTEKWGEIDIVAQKQGILHFVEVKTVSSPSAKATEDKRETSQIPNPEEMVHRDKQKRLGRAIQTYLAGKSVSHGTSQEGSGAPDWQFDIIAVFLDQATKQAHIRHSSNIIFSV